MTEQHQVALDFAEPRLTVSQLRRHADAAFATLSAVMTTGAKIGPANATFRANLRHMLDEADRAAAELAAAVEEDRV